MSTERTTLSAQIDSDTELAKQFEEYREQNAMTSRSEAVRHLVRAGLEQELSKQAGDDAADSTASGQSSGKSATDPDISINLIRGNEPILFGLAFVIGSEGFLTVTQSVAGAFWGSLLFAAIGIVIFASMLPMFWRALSHIAQNSSAADADDADANTSGVQG
jgi:Arc/MetJ-type ribon-helix-helix transcriptional regulator